MCRLKSFYCLFPLWIISWFSEQFLDWNSFKTCHERRILFFFLKQSQPPESIPCKMKYAWVEIIITTHISEMSFLVERPRLHGVQNIL